ncbi:hypothetical protein [Paracnuella aquatica]|uniref:hypothetical protein n=1 Tax=Paracnuella aquatica TaxID=2268757 RepID=UPI000DEEB8AD|nr:hypothetical protein [Paracnuella aquatica]RPD51294.1 hypothetical protein DRJ53_01025 [Paracnuella aquatica]
MRIIKLAVISFVFFFGLLFLMSLLVPSRVRISKAINLAPTDSTVLNLVRNQAEWKRWHPAYTADSARNQQLTKVTDTDTLVAFDITGRAPYPVRNSWEVHRFGAQDSLTLQWYMDFRLSYLPWHKFSSLFYEGTYGQMMEMGLNNIKKASTEDLR